MKFIIHNGDEDSIVIEGETISECQEKTRIEEEKRHWKRENCWSEKLEIKKPQRELSEAAQ